MQVIQHQELASAQSSITFSSIPQTFTDLVIVYSARSNRTGANVDTVRARFNGVTTGYSYRALEGTGSGTSSFTSTTFNAGICATDSCTASTFGNSSLYIPNYTSGVAKSGSADGVSESNATAANQFLTASYSTAIAAITSIEIAPETGTQFNQYSSATLYGITKGSDGIVTVS
jgi:hypothetical protein